MKKWVWLKILSLVLVVSMLLSAFPLNVLAEETEATEIYVKSVQLARAKTREEAKNLLEQEGYIFVDGNLNQGTGKDGIWMGYKTTTDPEEAVYDMKVMNMNGGFTLTSMEEALASQEAVFTEMAKDLNYLVEEFIEAYEEESVPALKAYKTLNFFRIVDNETELVERNGLGYQIVSGNISIPQLTEILLLCDSTLVDSIVKILTTGIQIRNGNWIKKLSEMGPYTDEMVYYEDEYEEEFKRRAEQLLPVLQLYSQAYNAMDLTGLIPDDLNENFEPEYDGDKPKDPISAEDAAAKKLDESRYKIYKIVFDELAKYKYGANETLRDFICSLENEGTVKDLYPLVSVLSDGEFAALSYGCFLEVACGATASVSDFDSYDEVYAAITEEAQSVYLYHGVEDILFEDDTVIGFTEAATRHMATTGELEFYEKETTAEQVWEVGKNVASIVGCAGLAVIGVAKIVTGISMGIVTITTAAATAAGTVATQSAVLAGIIKVGVMLGSLTSMLIVGVATLVIAVTMFIISAIIDEVNGWIDWDDNPMPEYLYDVKEVGFTQTSINGDIATEYMKKPVFALYEAVTDRNNKIIDLNARSGDAYQWIALYVSYDRQGEEAKPIKAEDLMVKTGNGETPEGYVPLSRFGEVVAYDLNQWDEEDSVNGVYVFYKQDQTVSVDSGRTYYIYDVYLQSGESDAHCINLLKAAGYTPLNVNLSPALLDGDFAIADKIYTYIGYKTTTNKSSAIRDIRVVLGPTQGQIQLGAATYAECGSNGQVTLYATKFEAAGTPLLAGGLICVSNPRVAAGYEPICTMTGGPAVSFNVDRAGKSHSSYLQTYLYFLPETTFTSGKKYIGDIAFFYRTTKKVSSGDRPGLVALNAHDPTILSTETYGLSNPGGGQSNIMMTTNDYWIFYNPYGNENSVDRVAYYTTYNPYRAIYDVKAAIMKSPPASFIFGGVGYVAFDRAEFAYTESTLGLDVNLSVQRGTSSKKFDDDQMSGVLYLSGNPDIENLHKASTNEMSVVQPLEASDIICSAPYKKKGQTYQEPTIPSNYTPVTDVFFGSKDAVEIVHEDGERKFKFYIAKSVTQKPYISNVFAIDEMSLFRSFGGYDKGLDPDNIDESMMLSHLAGQGATNFCGERIVINNISNSNTVYEHEINALKFGYARTDDVSKALRDVFLYFNKFTNDEPPKELYRGNTKYTVLCEIPYNYMDYNDAPHVGIYLYGTTTKKAGDPITELDVSSLPFMDGYETVRTREGRSVWQEIIDFVDAEDDIHPMNTARNLYTELKDFFIGTTKTTLNAYFYLHIKREGDDLRKQKPYINKFYIAGASGQDAPALDKIFDMGAEGYVNIDLNEATRSYVIYLGYSYTTDPNDAYTDIWAYHTKKHSPTMTNDKGITYEIVQEFDLNENAFGDYIWLYATKDAAAGTPITDVYGKYKAYTGSETITWVDGTQKTATTNCVKRWGTNSYSDMNRWCDGGEYIYIMFTGVNTDFKGTYKAPNYGKDKTFSRSSYKNVDPAGPYIGGVYVMDKNTILQEKIAAGTLAKGSKCDLITDAEVKERLKAMGATTIVSTPISVTGATYFKNNKNKVYIGYSHTDKEKYAIRGLAIKTQLLSVNEPADTITVDGDNYTLVAEAASSVTRLPRAVNLIGVDNGQDLLVPRMYLYYSTSADNEPIYDITIDSNPIKNGWLTAPSDNVLDPFADISQQAKKHADLAEKFTENSGGTDNSYYNIYSSRLKTWLSDISDHFKPENGDLTPFYIHTNHYTGTSLEKENPYIGEVFVVEGSSDYASLANLIAYGVDGYVECNLNRDAGGRKVYLGYKRTAKATDALRDLVVFQGKDPEETKRIDINGKSVKYTLVNNVDLNSKAGGKWLYLYSSDSADTGNPIKSLRIEEKTVSSLVCGVEQVTTKRADGKSITTENIDLNKGAGGDYLYLIMTRESEGGHKNLSSYLISNKNATCGEDGYSIRYYNCLDCGGKVEQKTVIPATGRHTDKENDGDHSCDNCGAKNLNAHKEGPMQKENIQPSTCTEKGSYHAVTYCVECEREMRNTVIPLPLDPDNHKDSKDADHDCDLCGAVKIEDHMPGEPAEENRIEPTEDTDGSYNKVVYCVECGEKLSEEAVVLPALNADGSDLVASLFGRGSVVIVCAFLGLSVLAAFLVYVQKKKKGDKGDSSNE